MAMQTMRNSTLIVRLISDYAGACHRAGHFGPDPLD
jgi:hypothetical protein